MSKTFKSIEETRELHVNRLGEDCVTLVINYKDAGRSGLTLAPSDAPALALAILEAAGWPELDHNSITRSIMTSLGDVIHIQERITAKAKEQAELEAEALELVNAWRAECGEKFLERWDAEEGDMIQSKPLWLAVARKAREMRAEK